MIKHSENTIQPIPYTGEISLRMGRRSPEIGTQVEHLSKTYQVTRIEPNGRCFGVPIKYLETFRRDRTRP